MAHHASRRVRCSAITFRELTAATGPCPCSARSPTSSTRGYSPVAFGETHASGTSRRSGASTGRSALCAERGLDLGANARVFVNHRGEPLTRFGVRFILAKYVRRAAVTRPRLARSDCTRTVCVTARPSISSDPASTDSRSPTGWGTPASTPDPLGGAGEIGHHEARFVGQVEDIHHALLTSGRKTRRSSTGRTQTEPIEIGLIEARQVELGEPIGRRARSRPQQRLGRLMPVTGILEAVVLLRQGLRAIVPESTSLRQ
jgi:hypothetical protein